MAVQGMMGSVPDTRPTAIVYVDGFNLYKGQLESKPENKWVNLVGLFDDVLNKYDVAHVHYFTARIKGRMTPQDPQAPDRQDTYIRALRTLARITVHDDSLFTVHHGNAREYVDGKERPPLTYHHVYKVQEKGSDVKLATQLLMDAMDRLADAYVVVSSDSDLAHPMRVAIERFGARVGVIYPRDAQTRLFTTSGIAFSLYLRPNLVARNQLPDIVHTAKRPVRRPGVWQKQSPAEAGP
ncbi:NYN domain-containing protein [Microbacterium bovistercoris]|uniref:NYN domain-containing protein n=1 Tax=Microbacterium bovistercoris TaxID=2293570 RepID=A0A371NVA6_9MICO|nr:NYN domain-containing protein [Microbacterium bovistercoris]REJ06304.1 NYN domain-containing protein [Microbacterium bovistercoris]